jgi:protein CWC15
MTHPTLFSPTYNSDDEDDTAELLRELEKIKRERAEEKERQERIQREEEERAREAQAAAGNPLLDMPEASTGKPKDFSVKRRWDEDVIFKNQARGMDDKPKKRFINDTLRSDFHRKFMNKYVQ